MSNFRKLVNVSNIRSISARGKDLFAFEEVCPKCGWAQSRTLEVGEARMGMKEPVDCRGRCSKDGGRNIFTVEVLY